MKKYNVGILGCGDFLRLSIKEYGLNQSCRMWIKWVFDPDINRAKKYADQFNAKIATNENDVLEDTDTDIVFLFMPPWARKTPLIKAATCGKHILTTKPLAPNIEDCLPMIEAVEENNIRCGIMYLRTTNSMIESLKKVFENGEIGKLAIYKQDWMHHYPQWNNWALDPSKNGGPFMDAMIHNLNVARYLMNRPLVDGIFFSESHAHKLSCNDTEFLKINFVGSGSAYLFITWAADLKVKSLDGNFREHIDNFYMITDQGWRVTLGKGEINASRNGESKIFQVNEFSETIFDRFIQSLENGTDNPSDLPTIREGYEDINIIENTAKRIGETTNLHDLC